ncbi:myb-like protein L [Gossypium australe]|uniref:Myb-like protein L n=1 Tax=Gossypium australe TaxID=47621 RepID=A0A5B6UPL9_9ROSI|nr:myb-like protein L [Gossypium australe]
MSLKDQYDTVNDEEEEVADVELSGNENGVGFDEDMEALKKACLRTGTDLNGLDIVSVDNERPSTSTAASPASADSGSEDDLEIFRSIRNRLALSEDVYEPLSLKPLCTLPPISSDEDAEDDFETLRVIQKRHLEKQQRG